MAGPVDTSELRAKIAALHGEEVAAYAELAALLRLTMMGYREAARRREGAESKVLSAVEALSVAKEREDDWRCAAHGLVMQVAKMRDAMGPGRSGPSSLSWDDPVIRPRKKKDPEIEPERYGHWRIEKPSGGARMNAVDVRSRRNE